MDTLATVLRIAATTGFMVLAYRMFQTQTYLQAPFFAGYSLFLGVYYLAWNPYNVAMLYACEPLLLTLRICTAIEAFRLATQRIGLREKRWLMLSCILIALVGIALSWNHSRAGEELAMYKTIRQHVHLSLALSCAFGCLLIWIEPPKMWRSWRQHGLILTLYYVNYAAVGFVSTRAGEKWLWTLANIAFFAGTCACIFAWLRWGLLAQMRHPHLKIRNTLL